MGLGLRLGFGLGAIASVSGVQWFLDSAAAGGGNGSATSPYNSISALLADPALDNNQTINLERDSVWREFLDLNAYDGMTVQASGTGADPIISAFDVVTGWSLTSGRTHTYEKVNFIPDYGTNNINSVLGFKEDGKPLVYQSSVANCEANPGSYAVTGFANGGVAQTVYIHPYGSTNPASDGKTYEVTRRKACIEIGDDATIADISLTGNISDDGALKAGRNLNYQRGAIRHGNNHNALAASGQFVDTAIEFNDEGQVSASPSLVVFFVSTTQTPKLTGLISGGTLKAGHPDATNFGNTQGWFCHDGEADISYSTVRVVGVDCDRLTHVGSGAADQCTVKGCSALRGQYIAGSGVAANQQIIDSFITYGGSGSTQPAAGKWIRAEGSRFYDRTGVTMITHTQAGSEGYFEQCSFGHVGGASGAASRLQTINTSVTGVTLGYQQCAISYAGLAYLLLSTLETHGATFTSEDNVFYRTGGNPALAIVVSGNQSLATWQGNTGTDSGSTVADLGFADPANDDFTPSGAGATATAARSAGAEYYSP
jgi:hypothetical protein